ncbi:MAG: FkbM family methyltransferase [Butyrivibrio sp.]|nr:FkbM family methyltransferase [Butyrivibrio sp.]
MNICHDFRFGKIMYNVLDLYVGKSLKLYGEYSPGEAALFGDILQPGDVVVEVGANIGAHTVRLAQLVGKEGKVIAFEPQRLCFQLLNGNVAINSLTNVYTYQKCVGASEGSVIVPELSSDEIHNWGGVSLANTSRDKGERVERIILDSLNLAKCKLLKIDVEGMELQVLQGAVKLLDKCQPLIYMEVDREDKKTELITFLCERGYKIYEHNPPLYSDDNYFHNPNNEFTLQGAQIVSFNALCVPPGMKLNMV